MPPKHRVYPAQPQVILFDFRPVFAMDDAQLGLAHVEEAPREPVARAKRTYGRKKETTDALLEAPSLDIPSFRTRLSSTGGQDALAGYRMSTPDADDASNTFGWRETLAKIDKQFEEEETLISDKPTDRALGTHALMSSSSAKSVSTEGSSSGGPDDSLLANSIPPLTSSQSDPPSPSPIKTKHANTKSSKVDLYDSDDEELPKALGTKFSSDSAGSAPLTLDGDQNLQPPARAALSGSESSADEASHKDSECKSKKVCSHKNTASKLKDRTNKIKKLSKKEEKESKKAHARIMADQKISVSKRATQFTVEDLLKGVQQKRVLSESKFRVASSDPIQEFTSSPMINAPINSEETQPKAGPSGLQDTSDDDMPDLGEILKQEVERKQKEEAEARRRESLALAKRRALESRKAHEAQSESSDSDLEFVKAVSDEAKPKKAKTTTAYEKRLAGVAGFRAGAVRHSLGSAFEGSQGDKALKQAAKPAFADQRSRLRKNAVDHRDLTNAMFSKASKQSMSLTKEKEEEWERRGGKLTGKRRAALATGILSLGELAEELALRRAHSEGGDAQEDAGDGESGSEDGKDADWQPQEHGSMSPSHHRGSKGSEDEEELEGLVGELSGEDMPDENVFSVQQEIETEDDDEPGQRSRQPRRPANRLVVSDSDGEENTARRTIGRVLVPETSMLFDDRYQGGTFSAESGAESNKENDTPAPFESDNDKENVMVTSPIIVGRPSLGSRQSSRLFDLEDRARRLSMSPADHETRTRKPLQERKTSELDDPFMLRSPTALSRFGSPKSHRTQSNTTSPILQPAFGGSGGGFTQLFNDDEGVAPSDTNTSPSGLLQPAFRLQTNQKKNDSPLRLGLSRKPMTLGGSLADPFSPESGKSNFLSRARRPAADSELSLTLDTRLQPALDVTTQIRRKADSVFEKEQELVLEEAGTSAVSARSKPELYISENGLLTQTKPEDTTPLVYRSWTPSQRSALIGSQASAPSTTQRLPLSTLSLSSEAGSPSQQRLSRLMKGKRRADSSADEEDVLSSPPRHPPSAFTKLLEGAKRQDKREKKKLGKSHFIEGEAQESDEDEMFGFGGAKKNEDDEESDDDDPNAVVENLVDDNTMDDQQLGEERVLEKYQEQTEKDDAELLKLAQDVAEGKFRGKRRGGGLVLDDSDSESDDDEDAQRRRRMNKKRRIQGDKLEDLAKDEKTRAYYEAYQRDVQQEDNEDFAHLTGDDMDVMDENDENEEPETITATELTEQLREAARQHNGKERPRAFDPENVEWAELHGTSDDEFDVKEVEDRPRKTAPRRPIFGQVDTQDEDDSMPRRTSSKMSEQEIAQLALWRREQSGRSFGTGGMRGAITVTGHGAKTDSRGGSSSLLKSASGRPHLGERPARKKLTKTASILASVSDRQKKFGR